MGQRIFECVLSIGTRSAQSIMASGLIAAQTGRTHDRTRPMLQLGQKVLAKAPSTHDPKRPSASGTSRSESQSLDHVVRGVINARERPEVSRRSARLVNVEFMRCAASAYEISVLAVSIGMQERQR